VIFKKLNVRQRINIVLNHKEPDKVPIDFGGTVATTITRFAYSNLRNFLNLDEEKNPVIAELICDTVRVSEDILLLYEIEYNNSW
jgi:uroporphyrinogen decarboxylase